MSEYCQKYICNQLNIENIGDGGWTTNGWSKYKREFEEVFRTLAQQGYAIVFISHDKEKTIKPQYGEEYQQICPSLQSSAETIVENMADIIGYAHTIIKDGQSKIVLTLRSNDNSIVCKSRFQYISPEIPFSYKALTQALTEAIDKEGQEHGKEFITTAPIEAVKVPTYDFEGLKAEFQKLAGQLMNTNQNNGMRIISIVDKYLGKGKKVNEALPNQVEQLDLIVEELKTLV